MQTESAPNVRWLEESARHDGRHAVKVERIARPHQVPKRYDQRRSDEKIDLSDLDQIIEIDPVARTCTAEPAVTFDEVVRATLRYDWLKAYCESTPRRDEDYLTTYDYLFRYDRGVTHVTPKSLVGRALFGKRVHSDSVLRAADRFHRFLPARSPPVIVDVFVPFSRTAEFMDWNHRERSASIPSRPWSVSSPWTAATCPSSPSPTRWRSTCCRCSRCRRRLHHKSAHQRVHRLRHSLPPSARLTQTALERRPSSRPR